LVTLNSLTISNSNKLEWIKRKICIRLPQEIFMIFNITMIIYLE
jgi:hypothetical protein